MTNAISNLTKYRVAIFIAAAAMVAMFFAPLNVSAVTTTGNFGVGTGDAVGELGLGTKALDVAVVGLINVALGFLGLIAVIIILIGGFKWMTAGGNEDKVGEARKTIFAGIIGLAIILFAWGITTFVIENLSTASGLDDIGLPA